MKVLSLFLGALFAPQSPDTPSPAVELVAAASLEQRPDAALLRRALSDRETARGALEILLAGRVSPTPSLPSGRRLRADLREILLDGLAEATSWRFLIAEHLTLEPSDTTRAAVLALLARAGERSDLALLFALAGTTERTTPRVVTAALRETVAQMVRRHEQLAEEFRRRIEDLDPAAALAVVDGLGDSQTRLALAELAGLLQRRELRTSALAALVRCAEALPGPHDEDVRAAVRACLDDEPHVVAQAALAVEATEDYDAVPALIELLQSDVAAHSAARALRSLSGVDFRSDAEAWSLWYGHASRRWEESRAWASHASFRADDPELRRGLRLLASSRFQRHARAELLLRALREGSPELSVYACRGLALLGSHAAVSDLIDLLDAADDDLRAASYSALCNITRADLPPERGEWLAHFFSDTDPWSDQ